MAGAQQGAPRSARNRRAISATSCCASARLRHAAVRGGLLVYQQQGIVVLTKSGGANVAHQQRHTLAQTLRSGMGQQIVVSAAKPRSTTPQDWAGGAIGPRGQGCRGSPQNSAPGLARAILLDFSVDWFATRQSATAAVAINRVAPALAPQRLRAYFVLISHPAARTPRGVGKCTGPATRVTSAPASRAARAMAKPIFRSKGW